MLNLKTLVKAYCNLFILTSFIDINIKKQVENQIRGGPSFLNFKKFEKIFEYFYVLLNGSIYGI